MGDDIVPAGSTVVEAGISQFKPRAAGFKVNIAGIGKRPTGSNIDAGNGWNSIGTAATGIATGVYSPAGGITVVGEIAQLKGFIGDVGIGIASGIKSDGAIVTVACRIGTIGDDGIGFRGNGNCWSVATIWRKSAKAGGCAYPGIFLVITGDGNRR